MNSLPLLALLVLCSGALSQACDSYTLPAVFANTTASLSDDSQFPLGYRRDTLPNPELMQPNPCYTVDLTVNGTDRAYIELALELTNPTQNARICVTMDGAQPSCDSTQAYLCDDVRVTDNTLTVTVSCEDSCTLSDLIYYYRFTLSPTPPEGQDNELWCLNRPRDFPSSLLTLDGGSVTPSVGQPTQPTEGASTISTFSLISLLLVASFVKLLF